MIQFLWDCPQPLRLPITAADKHAHVYYVLASASGQQNYTTQTYFTAAERK